MGLRNWLDRRFYRQYTSNWDDHLFRKKLLQVITPDSRVLDLGAGRGLLEQMNFRGQCKFIAGVDPDDAVLINEQVDEAKLLRPPAYSIPYSEREFDVVFSNNVLEHIADPAAFLAEVSRVLKPGGVFLAKTPNRTHYVAAIARMTPHRFHQYVNKLRGRSECDTFPTVYSCNTRRDIAAAATANGLTLAELQIIEGRPEYLRMNPLTYAVGIAYERIVNRFEWLTPLRCVIIAKLSKPLSPATTVQLAARTDGHEIHEKV